MRSQTWLHFLMLDIIGTCHRLCSVMSNSLWPCDCSPPGSSVHEIFPARREYWRGLSFPPPGLLPDPGIKLASPVSPALASRFFITVPGNSLSLTLGSVPSSPQGALVIRNPPASAADSRVVGSIPGLGRSPGGGNGNPPQYSCLGNPMDGEPGELQSIGSQRVGYDWAPEHVHTHQACHLVNSANTAICVKKASYMANCLLLFYPVFALFNPI